jgi:hypothetical protein
VFLGGTGEFGRDFFTTLCFIKQSSFGTFLMNFNTWLSHINTALYAKHGFDIGDLPDEPFYDYYEDNLTPDQVVGIMIQNNMCLVE